jgi:hypothetical protein
VTGGSGTLLLVSLPRDDAFEAAFEAAFPGLPEGVDLEQAERRVEAAVEAYLRRMPGRSIQLGEPLEGWGVAHDDEDVLWLLVNGVAVLNLSAAMRKAAS